MDDSKTETPSALGVNDIYYVLFKHKWKIIACTLIGLLAAAAAYRFWPDAVYRSDAKLFIRYVEEATAPPSATEDAQVKPTDLRGETIINGEVEILTSMDLAKKVAVAVGPQKILAAVGGGADVDAAASVIRSGLRAGAAKGSRVVELTFQHPNPGVVRPVLSALIDEYLKAHVEIHMSSGMFDNMLSDKTRLLRDHLAKTEEELRKLQDQAGVVSLEESKRANAEQMAKLQQQIWDATLELNEREAVLREFEQHQTTEEAVPAAKAQDYRTVVAVLESQTQKYQELLTTFSAESDVMTNLRRHIAENTARREQLEKEYPALTAVTAPARPGRTADAPVYNPQEERAQLRVITTKLQVLREDFERMRKGASDLGALEMSISDLQRRRDLQEAQYRYFSSSLEKARINEALGSGRVSNISTIESPTPPVCDVGKLYKVVGGLAGGGVAVGLGLAFCLEIFLDQTVRRAEEIETLLGLPLFFSLPLVHGGWGREESSLARLAGPPGAAGNNRGVLRKLASYFDGLSDRLIFYFEVRGLVKKPKLVAVTNCGDRAGASTVAAGLASALSKSGEGNVLLVDMNTGKNRPYHFRNGEVRVGLDELLDGQNRDEAMVQDNLYVVPHAVGNERLARILPKRFTDMVPRLRASDYEYIIFDMPAVSQVSVTPQLSRFMDMVFLVVGSEKTNRGAVKRASSLLNEASCTLGVIVNRTRNYLPRALLQEV
jgi:uncharacterized protein involved in exopolysaccharide biosynthesis